jgi:imidazole glycerol-phosphate synthase subunit HisH
MSRVVLVDYGVGNMHSVKKALVHEGADVVISSDPIDARRADRLVLPGVGAFADCMREIRKRHLVEALQEYLSTGRPFLGICVGMQVMLASSDEFGHTEGLAHFPGAVRRIANEPGIKVPHVGWNRIVPAEGRSWDGTALEGLDKPMVYFVHSFNAVPENESDRLADAQHGSTRICAAIGRGNVIGCQFHPEKSGPVGLAVIRRFLTI